MAIISLRAWYLEQYEPLKELENRPHDLRLSKQSLLKAGLRADFLDEVETVREADWFARYLEGETVEFYIEGSGGYAISNIDLISHEIYFTKRDIMAHLEPKIFLCHQTDYPASWGALEQALESALTQLNKRSRVLLSLEIASRPIEEPLRMSEVMMRRIRKSLLFIADVTPVTVLEGSPSQLMPSPKVCLELGYALQSKRTEQILLACMERPDLTGQLPFDLPNHQLLWFKRDKELQKTIPTMLEAMLQRLGLLS